MQNKKSRLFFIVVIAALIIKLSLFAFAAITAPQGKMLPDSYGYLKLSETLASDGIFAIRGENGNLSYEIFRTPGYPMFLAIFNGLMKVPLDGIILIQIAMTLLAAFIVYKTALQIDQGIALLSAAIILLDPPITIFSLTILTESLFLLLIAIFMYIFTLYLKNKNIGYITLSALVLAASAYVRPIAYYLGFALPFFIIYANGRRGLRRGLSHALIFIAVVYSIVGIWHGRNYIRCGDAVFCVSDKLNLSSVGLFKSYARNTDPHTQGMAPLPYYISASFRSFMSLMTRPGNFKYFQCEALNLGSFVFSYPWMVFWLSGFIWGAIKITLDTIKARSRGTRGKAASDATCLKFMLFMVLYFSAASVGGLMWSVSERLRVPMMPFIAVISAYGWKDFKKRMESVLPH